MVRPYVLANPEKALLKHCRNFFYRFHVDRVSFAINYSLNYFHKLSDLCTEVLIYFDGKIKFTRNFDFYGWPLLSDLI